jgi:hypothetical protein
MTDGGRAAMSVLKLKEIVENFDEFAFGKKSIYEYYTEAYTLCSEVAAIARKRLDEIDSMSDESMMKQWYKGELKNEGTDLPDRINKYRRTENVQVAAGC